MYKADLPADESVLRAVERRRAAEAERKNRIFSTRTRVIGVDPRALHKQREEKQEQQEMEKQRDMVHGTTTHFCTKLSYFCAAKQANLYNNCLIHKLSVL